MLFFRDSWGAISNDTLTLKTRRNVGMGRYQTGDKMFWGNKQNFYMSDNHDYLNPVEVKYVIKLMISIITYTYKHNAPLNNSVVSMAQNTVTNNLNITHTDRAMVSKGALCLISMGLPGKIASTNVWGFFIIQFVLL